MSQPVTQWLRELGIACVWYVDDLLIVAKDKETLGRQVFQVLSQLTKLGIQVNFKKSQLEPTMIVSYLGDTMNLVAKTFHPMAAKVKAAKATLQHLLKLTTTDPRFLVKAAGQLLDPAKAVQELLMLMQEAGKAVAHQRRCKPFLAEKSLWALIMPKPSKLRSTVILALAALERPSPNVMCATQGAPHYQLYVEGESHRLGRSSSP